VTAVGNIWWLEPTAMIKRSDKQKQVKRMGDSAVKTPLVRMVFEVTPEVQARLEKWATSANMSVPEAAGVILGFLMNKQDSLEAVIEEKVGRAFNKELERVEDLIEAFLSTPEPLASKRKKEFSN
jgi:hypothetical protein